MSTITIQPDNNSGYDTYLDQTVPAVNLGSSAQLLAGIPTVGGKLNTTAQEAHTLIRFDLSAIPSGATINSATLTLVNMGQGQINGSMSLSIGRVTQTGWTVLGATWLKYDGTNAWNTQGGDFVFDSQITVSDPSANSVFDATRLVADALLNRGRLLNVGMWGGGASDTVNFLVWASSRDATPTNRPSLVINYTAPLHGIPARSGLAGGMRDLTAIQ